MNTFEIIPSEQTPKVPEITNLEKFIKENREVINDFKTYAESKDNAIGLAANQCNLNNERFMLRIAAIKNSNSSKRECEIAIDPRIIKSYGMIRKKIEGCLTWEGQIIVADRYHFVDVAYYNPEGEFVTETHKGFQAQVWQHEINHLNGIEEEVIGIRDIPILEKEDIGRNEKCPCGSGKKYKQCCIEN